MAEADTVDRAQGELIKLSILVGLSGACTSLSIGSTATVEELRTESESCIDTGGLTYRLLMGGVMLDPPTVGLQDFDVVNGSAITLVKLRAWDYTKICNFEQTIRCLQYPNGVLVNETGHFFVCHYFGELSVYGSDCKMIRQAQLPCSCPSRMAWTPSGELLVAFRDRVSNGKVGLFCPESLALSRWLVSGVGGHGLAVCGDRVFVSDSEPGLGRIHAVRLSDGELLATLGGTDSLCSFQRPGGLAVIEDRLLAVADRGGNCVRLISLDTLCEVSQIPNLECVVQPNDVAVDSAGHLLIMDTGNERIAVFREDGSFVAGVMPGFFKNHGNTSSYLDCNLQTGQIAVSNNDRHKISVLAPL
mmetsp:Transcript_40654/g.130882  ORF Transcript_40654/g.130882 Transcript_40654/m.130882 type:complete len:360 (-) Transcript_40654:246-1325(-)|eukprot:CAMPEP_0203846364 /NCGR_PEP_ID=MMETSP0359-20131031/4380_1 /ASSEMBLY_ACC=CAM_ASM_000338 /TAXON_ID=268821 /ORGANISM="Scrippsiella Hangoei, Strain SHTV-5" /LENGTH=359 /DNA_ID=CAMNT_0050761673 /DNA_START=47 /DNA_END=1126 /DNA_ORIENTATION=+